MINLRTFACATQWHDILSTGKLNYARIREHKNTRKYIIIGE
ncbi:hypothetical protein CLHUN_34240 [Ruminiclostridium hungatei]|uniref:Uncharacterized protein n=1 Tax=Ruminiclostridium hungatei TaxID=48256 RepID=A0A1V4SFM4_RUMHU|nr:hypothetical protein CLHUN_34240 [Ruminiclostridium hungatei]